MRPGRVALHGFTGCLGLILPILFQNFAREATTHDPNLVVTCDVGQIVCASLDKVNSELTQYLSGSIEDATMNKPILDILEGVPRFQPERGSKTNLRKKFSAR
jgi:hypothetical protein